VEFRLKQAFGGTATVHIDKVDEAVRSLFNGYSYEIGVSNQIQPKQMTVQLQ
jgi:hypothetical protein